MRYPPAQEATSSSRVQSYLVTDNASATSANGSFSEIDLAASAVSTSSNSTNNQQCQQQQQCQHCSSKKHFLMNFLGSEHVVGIKKHPKKGQDVIETTMTLFKTT